MNYKETIKYIDDAPIKQAVRRVEPDSTTNLETAVTFGLGLEFFNVATRPLEQGDEADDCLKDSLRAAAKNRFYGGLSGVLFQIHWLVEHGQSTQACEMLKILQKELS